MHPRTGPNSQPYHTPPGLSSTVPVVRQPRLYVASNGQGCPCLDLYRLPRTLCQAAQTADLIILEGMGRSILTNYQARFHVAALKVRCSSASWAESVQARTPVTCCCLFCGSHGADSMVTGCGCCRWP